MPARPPRPSADHHSLTDSLKSSVETLQGGWPSSRPRRPVTGRIELDRERLDRVMAELLQVGLDAQTAEESVTRLKGEQKALRLRPWWRQSEM